MFTGQFVPSAGTLFYVKSNGYDRVINTAEMQGYGAVQAVIRTDDNSYCDDVFRALGADDTHVVGVRLTDKVPDRASKKIVFPRHQWKFAPVGPSVAAALGLVDHTTDQHEGQAQ